MVAVPAAEPQKKPGLSIEPTVEGLLLHVPPVVVTVYVLQLPTHIASGPVIADGVAFTVMVVVTKQPDGNA